MRVFFLIVVLIFASSAHSQEWTTTDKALLGTAVVLTVIDWGQTRNMTRSPNYIGRCPKPKCVDPYYEHNPILGESPTIGEVDKYFTVVLLGTVGLSYALPQKWRRVFLGGVITIESIMVIHNHQIGLRAEF